MLEPLDWEKLKKSYRGRLPHWEVPGMTAFVTFRLADSLPVEVVERYRRLRDELQRAQRLDPQNPEIRRDLARLFTKNIDKVLDSGCGSCWLARPEAGSAVMNALRHFDGARYHIHAAVVMPNHVHAVVTLGPNEELSKVMHSWKSFTSHLFAKDSMAPKPLWQGESYDHVIRDEGEFFAYLRYTARNPVVAGLADWPFLYLGEGMRALLGEEAP